MSARGLALLAVTLAFGVVLIAPSAAADPFVDCAVEGGTIYVGDGRTGCCPKDAWCPPDHIARRMA